MNTPATRTVRDATFDVFRRFGMTTIFANPGSTEISFLTDLPDDIEFVLALHEGSVVGIATGYATARERPALVNLHTTAGLGNAVGALATARVNRVPLVVIVGQQDRRHLAYRPFLAGDLEGLAGTYPVWVHQPARPQDVPSAVARAWHEATGGRGPALVIVPSDDWDAPADDAAGWAAPEVLHRATAVAEPQLAELTALLAGAVSPVLVVGADADHPDTWAALVRLAERLSAPVWQESFAARAGFPQDHPLFAGHLPAGRARLRAALAGHDVVLAVGAPVFRQYPYEQGPLVEPSTTVALVTDDAEDAHHSPVQLAVVASPAPVCAALAERVPERRGSAPPPGHRPERPAPPRDGEPLRATHVLAALAERIPANTVVVEETPSSRPELHRLLPARAPLGFLSAAMGGLGFGLPAAVGVRMADPRRPVVAVLGDGSSLYGIQALWSAAHYGTGVLFVVLANGRYAVMDRLAERHGQGKAPWPAFEEVRVHEIARGLGCPARRVDTYQAMIEALDEVVPTLPGRSEPARAGGRGRPGHDVRTMIRYRRRLRRRKPMAGNSSGGGRTVVSRALAVLGSFSKDRPEQTLGEIQQATGMASATAHRLASELVEWGALDRVGRGRYRVGLRLWQVGSLAPQARDLRDVALPFLQDLLEVTREVVHLAVLDDGQVLYIERLMSRPEVQVRSRVARRLPLHATGPGKVLLAYSRPEYVEEVIAAGLPRQASRTITDAAVLRRALTGVRRTGYCLSRDEITDGPPRWPRPCAERTAR